VPVTFCTPALQQSCNTQEQISCKCFARMAAMQAHLLQRPAQLRPGFKRARCALSVKNVMVDSSVRVRGRPDIVFAYVSDYPSHLSEWWPGEFLL
jgi:hypothetical protein